MVNLNIEELNTIELLELSKEANNVSDTTQELIEAIDSIEDSISNIEVKVSDTEPIDATIAQEALKHYRKVLGIKDSSNYLSTEYIKSNSINSIEEIKYNLEGILDTIKSAGKKIWEWLVEIITKVINFIKEVWYKLTDKLTPLISNIENNRSKIDNLLHDIPNINMEKADYQYKDIPVTFRLLGFINLIKILGKQTGYYTKYLDGILELNKLLGSFNNRDSILDSLKKYDINSILYRSGSNYLDKYRQYNIIKSIVPKDVYIFSIIPKIDRTILVYGTKLIDGKSHIVNYTYTIGKDIIIGYDRPEVKDIVEALKGINDYSYKARDLYKSLDSINKTFISRIKSLDDQNSKYTEEELLFIKEIQVSLSKFIPFLIELNRAFINIVKCCYNIYGLVAETDEYSGKTIVTDLFTDDE